MIRDPSTRYGVFQLLQTLCELRGAIEIRPLWEWDGAPLIETIETLSQIVGKDPQSRLGEVFFNEAEVQAVSQVLEFQIDWNALYAQWEHQVKYLHSTEFKDFLELACKCIDVMLRVGAGLPGWKSAPGNHQNSESLASLDQ